MTHQRKMKFSVEIEIVHQIGPLHEAERIGDAIEAHIDGETVQLTTDEAFPVRSTYVISSVEVLEELT